jgi:hypothetical protein
MSRSTPTIMIVLAAALMLAAATGPAAADCSDGEVSAVLRISGLLPGEALSVDVLAVTPLGLVTYPDDNAIIADLLTLMPDVAPIWQPQGDAGPISLFVSPPMDFGGAALVDRRDGAILFAGTVVWSGQGQVVTPVASTHTWTGGLPEPASAPASLDVLILDWDDSFGTPAAITDAALEILRRTDVVHSFAGCGEYSVVAFLSPPTVGTVDPAVAELVVVVQGRCGPPWNGDPVASERLSWSSIKDLFH